MALREQADCIIQAALQAMRGLQKEDTVLFLLSGGGSALMEQPFVDTQELDSVTKQLLAGGRRL